MVDENAGWALLIQVLPWGVALAILIAVGAYLAKKTRPTSDNQHPEASELLSNFREMHSEGQLSDEEYRTIKTALANRLKQELNNNGETG
jgi:uncharacterized membrane protein